MPGRYGRLGTDIATIARDVGSLVAMESALMAGSALVAAVFSEWYVAGAFLLAAAVTGVVGAAGSTVGGIKIIRLYTIGRGIAWQFGRVFLPANAVVTAKMGDRTLNRQEMEAEFSEAAIVSLLWLVLLAVGSLLMVNLAPAEFGYPTRCSRWRVRRVTSGSRRVSWGRRWIRGWRRCCCSTCGSDGWRSFPCSRCCGRWCTGWSHDQPRHTTGSGLRAGATELRRGCV